ncbi:MAG: hypothetical protein WKH64_11900 [Chloroflexia bacterium]
MEHRNPSAALVVIVGLVFSWVSYRALSPGAVGNGGPEASHRPCRL